MNIQDISSGLGLLLQIGNLIIIGYGLYKFTRKPHDTLSDEVTKIKEADAKRDVKIEEIKKSLDASHEKHRQQEETNATFKSVMLAFINFEIAYCRNTGYEDNQDLLDAKKELSEYLTGKRHHEKEKD